MPIALDMPGGWYDIPDTVWAAGADAIEDLLVSLNSLVRFACVADEYFGGYNLLENGVVSGFVLSAPATGLIPTITAGVLYAQGVKYAPGAAPVLPSLPTTPGTYYLWYSSTAGFYWSASQVTPNAPGDCLVGSASISSNAGVISGFVLAMPTPSGLTPTITAGVLYAQGIKYAPAAAPNLPACSNVNGTYYLWYDSNSGWYWNGSQTVPNNTNDCLVGSATVAAGVISSVTSYQTTITAVQSYTSTNGTVQALFRDSERVPLPQSADDGYSYGQSECIFPYALNYSPSPDSGRTSGPGDIVGYNTYVEQDTGAVHSYVSYYVPGHNGGGGHDGLVSAAIVTRRSAGVISSLEPVQLHRPTGGGPGGGGGAVQVRNLPVPMPGGVHGDPLARGGIVRLS